MKLHPRKQNNRGAALLSVIIAMTVVAVLGIGIMYVTYSNLSMKQVDRKSKDNFYTAESVLDQVTAGLENLMTDEYESAYTKVMSHYAAFSSTSAMQQEFTDEYVLNMMDTLAYSPERTVTTVSGGVSSTTTIAASTVGTGYYNTGLLEGFITLAGGTFNTAADKAVLKTLTDGLLLQNVSVTYLDATGYTDTITTDIKISVPTVEFSLISAMPQITDYAYVADDGIDIGQNLTLTLKGAAYSGTATTTSPSITIEPGATLDATHSSLLVAGGDVNLSGGANLYTGSGLTGTNTTKTSFWLKGLEAETSTGTTALAKNTVSLLGKTYVADDITVSGSENTLTLGGQYYGYGTGSTASASSAIIINGKDTTLNMSALDTLIIAGTAYVSGSTNGTTISSVISAGITDTGKAADDTTDTNADIMTGDAIAVKSNQLAYLVPTECAGITTNPMSYSQYKKLTENDANWRTTALNTTISFLHDTLISAGVTTITPVFSSAQGGTVYLFLEFADTNDAAAYFMNVYGSSTATGTKLQNYLSNYLKAFSFNVNSTTGEPNLTRLLTNGNYLVPATYDNTTGTWTGAAYEESSGSAGVISNELAGYQRNYEALCTKMVNSTSSLTDTEKSSTVYANLIDETAIKKMLSYSYASGAAISGVPAAEIGTGTVTAGKAVFKSSDNSEQVIVCVGNLTIDSTEAIKKGIIIATGDVTIKTDWTGVILCGGKLTISGTSVLSADSGITGSALRLSCVMADSSGNLVKDANNENISYMVLNFFKGGENYSVSDSTDTENATIDVRNCITYENWKSE